MPSLLQWLSSSSPSSGGAGGASTSSGGSDRTSELLHSIHNRNWGRTSELLRKRRYRDRARRVACDGMTVLHCACWAGHAPAGVIRALIKAYPAALGMKDEVWGFTPLHMACYTDRATADMVGELVRSYPAAASMRDEQNLTAMHRTCLAAGDNVSHLVGVLLAADPTQAKAEIRDWTRDSPFHLLMARAHHELQKSGFDALRTDPNFEGHSPFHDERPMLEGCVDAAFLVLKAEEFPEEEVVSGGVDVDRDWRARVFVRCLGRAKCPDVRLFLYVALWHYPELAAYGLECQQDGHDEGKGETEDDTEEEENAVPENMQEMPALEVTCHSQWEGSDYHDYHDYGYDEIDDGGHMYGDTLEAFNSFSPGGGGRSCPYNMYFDTLEGMESSKSPLSQTWEEERTRVNPSRGFTESSRAENKGKSKRGGTPKPSRAAAATPSLTPTPLHASLLLSKSDVGDAHWCVNCRRGLVDPHFVSRDTGESCDVTCAHRLVGGDGAEESDGGGGGGATTWYRRNRERLYKDITVTVPYGTVIGRLAALYPQASSVPFPPSMSLSLSPSSPPPSSGDDDRAASDRCAIHDVPDRHAGRLPLHAALAGGHTWYGGILALYRSHPPALSARDPITGLFPFMLAAVRKPNPPGDDDWGRKRYFSELSTVFELLRRGPELAAIGAEGEGEGGGERGDATWYDDVSLCYCDDWIDFSATG